VQGFTLCHSVNINTAVKSINIWKTDKKDIKGQQKDTQKKMDNNGKWMGWKTNWKKEHAAAHGSINQCQIYEQWHGSVPLTEFIKPQIRSHCAPLFRPQAAETNFGKILEVI